MKIEVPVLETARLRMRGHRVDDLADCTAMWGDAGVTRFIGGIPFTVEDVWARILRYAGHWAWLEFGPWIVEEKETGRFVGEVGFAEFKRIIHPPLERMPEIGWVLTPGAQGLGYATEAALAAIEWATGRLGPVRTACIIHPDNEPSLRVAAKCGYAEFARTVYKGQPTILLRREG
jgi:RimJ/RimL family protein N-acetyltransferase